MINDIYNRNISDPNYMPGQVEMDDLLELFKQQIESCLFTPKTSVMGSTNFGGSLDEFVWSFKTSNPQLQQLIFSQINEFCTLAKHFPYKVEVSFYHGTIRDIAEINIEIRDRDRFSILMG